MAWNGHKPIIVWFSGMSGAGKTTLSDRVVNLMRAHDRPVVALDGDVMRNSVSNDLDFSLRGRYENIRRAAETARMVYGQGISVICSFITPTEDLRVMLKEILGNNFVHVFLDCSLEECQRRDVKGLYKAARNGKVSMMTGVGAAFEPPTDADLVIETGRLTEQESITEIRNFLWGKYRIYFM